MSEHTQGRQSALAASLLFQVVSERSTGSIFLATTRINELCKFVEFCRLAEGCSGICEEQVVGTAGLKRVDCPAREGLTGIAQKGLLG